MLIAKTLSIQNINKQSSFWISKYSNHSTNKIIILIATSTYNDFNLHAVMIF